MTEKGEPDKVEVDKVTRQSEPDALRLSWDGNGWNSDEAWIMMAEKHTISLTDYE